MRVLLRRARNGFYYQKDGTWVNNSSKGFNFGAIHRAMEFAETWNMDGLELALAFDSSPHISAVPLRKGQGEPVRNGRRRDRQAR